MSGAAGGLLDAALRLFQSRGLRHLPDTLQVARTRLVPLLEDDELIAGFDKDTRYGVRRAEREGVSVRVVEDAREEEAIHDLHGLVVETQRRAGFPLVVRSDALPGARRDPDHLLVGALTAQRHLSAGGLRSKTRPGASPVSSNCAMCCATR